MSKDYNCPYCEKPYEYDTCDGLPDENDGEWVECICNKLFYITCEVSYAFYSYKPNVVYHNLTKKSYLTTDNKVGSTKNKFVNNNFISKKVYSINEYPWYLNFNECNFMGEDN